MFAKSQKKQHPLQVWWNLEKQNINTFLDFHILASINHKLFKMKNSLFTLCLFFSCLNVGHHTQNFLFYIYMLVYISGLKTPILASKMSLKWLKMLSLP